MNPYSDAEMKHRQIESAREAGYRSVIPYAMSRQERRTPRGRLLVAEAEIAALRAELEATRQQLEDLQW